MWFDVITSFDLADSTGSDHLALGKRAVSSLRRLAEQLESLHVNRARDLGWSWSQIAIELGASNQAVPQKTWWSS